MSASDLPELLPCPFCGGTDIGLLEMHGWSNDDPAKTTTQSECRGCGTCGPEVLDVDGESDEDVERRMRAAWNTRAGDKRAREALQTGWAIEITRPDGGKHLFTGNGSPSHKPEVWEERFWGLARKWRGHLANRGLAAELVRVLWVPPTVLAAAPVLGEQALCPACGHDVNSPLCPCDPPVP